MHHFNLAKSGYILLILTLVCLQSCSDPIDQYDFKFGILEVTPDGYVEVKKETTDIPLITRDKGFLFGFIIHKLDGGEFSGQLTVHFPSRPQQLTGKAKGINIEPNKTMKFPVAQHKMVWTESSWFDEGDPEGVWKYDIYLNGKLYKEIKFNVTP